MALFAKDYHPLDSRHPRNRAGAHRGLWRAARAQNVAFAEQSDQANT